DDSRVKTDGRFLNENSISESIIEKIKKLNNLANERGQTLAQMALSWVYSKEGITSVLIGASKDSQILENIKMKENTTFSKEELDLIDEIVK
ncbi:MAG: L-glyceraldehyde 3-phosphate reductase, partial [Ruminococcaceae bacterium]|nr:L-glyceraldehyde 3-phosphate reductase [Oscillospiraceae bacterium]